MLFRVVGMLWELLVVCSHACVVCRMVLYRGRHIFWVLFAGLFL